MTGLAPVMHGSCVAHAGRGVLILGRSGAGKSTLALRLMALGARLVADDRVTLHRDADGVTATCPPSIRGRIEARGLGILSAHPVAAARLVLVVDLDLPEPHRLPPLRTRDVAGVDLPLLHNVATGSFPAAILQYLREGRDA